jgi:5-formyltetrahydrofolate cyclo-ligase
MTAEEELNQLRRDKQQQQEYLAHRDELIAQMQQQAALSEQVQTLPWKRRCRVILSFLPFRSPE